MTERVGRGIAKTLLVLGLLAAAGTVYANPADVDPTFGLFGRVTTGIGSGYSPGSGLVRQTDGKLVVAGSVWNGSNYDFGLARYQISGILDSTFGSGGLVITAIGTSNDQATAMVLQSDGKLVVAGFSAVGSDYDFAIARYNTNGTLDSGFGTGGKVTTSLGGFDVAMALALQSDGKLVVAGSTDAGSGADVALVRYNTNGTLDGGFGVGGKVITSVTAGDDGALAVVVQGDGKIVVAGSANNGGDYDVALVRYASNGSLDGGFGSGGTVTTPIGPADDVATSIIQQPNGMLVVAGYVSDGVDYDFALARYDSLGALDAGFGTGGLVTTPIGTAGDQGSAVVRQPDGKLVVAGFSYDGTGYDIAVARYDGTGALDPVFGTGGTVTTPIGIGDDNAVSILLQPDGKIVVAGSSMLGTTPRIAIVRYRGEAVSLGCSLDAHCDDGVACTVDTCVSNDCIHTPNNTACNDNDACTSDVCSASLGCQHPPAPSGTACPADSTVCALHRCNGAGTCTHVVAPAPSCALSTIPLKSVLQLKDSVIDNADKVVFSWSGGPGVPVGDLGDPTTSTSYELCVFDETAGVPALAVSGRMAAGGTCGSGPCWKPLLSGFKFKNNAGLPDGMTNLMLKATSVAGRSKFKVTGKGVPLTLPTIPLHKDPRVTAELRNSGGKCWSARFSNATFNGGGQFKAKSD